MGNFCVTLDSQALKFRLLSRFSTIYLSFADVSFFIFSFLR